MFQCLFVCYIFYFRVIEKQRVMYWHILQISAAIRAGSGQSQVLSTQSMTSVCLQHHLLLPLMNLWAAELETVQWDLNWHFDEVAVTLTRGTTIPASHFIFKYCIILFFIIHL